MFSTIYVPLDNSEHANAAMEVALSLALAFGGRIAGSHVYAARMHDYRFKQMEYTLPEEYQDEEELERQRKIHDTLITRGLRLISDSYTDVAQVRCAAAGVPFEPRTMDGRNWEKLVEDITTNNYDLVVMGAQGFGATKEAQLGSVCERVIRRIRTDTLIVKEPRAWSERPEGSIAVCVDGSPQSFGGLRAAIELGKALGRPVEAVAVYDPYLHYAMFNGIVHVLSQEASKVFRFKEQEQLHEEIIDTGLAKIYESHLQVARRVAEQEGIDLKVTLLDGKAWDKIAHWARTTQPWLLVMGRIGVHSDEQMDIGSNSEHLLRAVGCNVLLTSSTYVPPVDVRAEEIIVWTPEANARMERIPAFVRGVARTAIHRWAFERGTSIISSDIIDEACADILPPSAAAAMGIAAKSVAVEDERRQIAAPGSAATLQPGAVGHAGKTYVCGECGYAARDVLPVACPICRSGPERFALLDPGEIARAAAEQGPITDEQTFDGKKVAWTEEARRLLFSMSDAYARRRAKARIEKQARTRRLPAVTVEFASPVIQEMIGDLAHLHANSHLEPEQDSIAYAAIATATEIAGGIQPAPRPATHSLDQSDRSINAPSAEVEPEADADADATGIAETTVSSSLAQDEPEEHALPWSDEALARLERVPAGYMRDMTRDLILRHADETGATAITLAVAEGGITLAKREMVMMISDRRKASRAASNSAQSACPVASPAAVAGDRETAPLATGSAAGLLPATCPTTLSTIEIESRPHVPQGEPPCAPTDAAAKRTALNEVKPAFIARLARYYAPGGAGTAGHQVPPALDFAWDAAAERALNAVPVYCRDLARWRVEWTAYTLHLGRLITLDVWQRDHPDWDELARHLVPARLVALEWEPEARARLEAVPPFIRPQVALAMEINLAHAGAKQVTLGGFERVAEQWRGDLSPTSSPAQAE